MKFNIDNFSTLILLGLIFTLTGLIMYYFPPKNINGLYGYRTGSSMSSPEKWNYSQKYSALLMAKWGAFMAVAGVIFLAFPIEPMIEIALGVAAAIAACIVLFLKTERAITQKFGK